MTVLTLNSLCRRCPTHSRQCPGCNDCCRHDPAQRRCCIVHSVHEIRASSQQRCWNLQVILCCSIPPIFLNVVIFDRFSDVHNCRELIAASTKFIQDLFPIVCCEEEFLDLPKEQLCFFLSSEQLKVDSEFQVFTRVLFKTPRY